MALAPSHSGAIKRGRSGSFDAYSENSNSPVRPRGGSEADGPVVGSGNDSEATRAKVLHAERMSTYVKLLCAVWTPIPPNTFPDRIALQNMSEAQRDRFEFFTRSHFDKHVIKKMMMDAFNTVRQANVEGFVADTRNLQVDVNEQMVIVMSALSKMFVGDLVHGARQVMDERADEGPIQPRHLREAYRRAVRDKKLPVVRDPAIIIADR